MSLEIRGPVLVTGASRGIGRAVVHLLVEHGVETVGISRSEVDGFPGRHVACDLADRLALASTLAELTSEYQFSGLVNNAGLLWPSALTELDWTQFDEVIAVNLRATIQVTQALVPGMVEQQYGRIVSIGSRADRGAVGRTAYSAAKSGVNGATRTWALEFGRSGLTANVVAPGPVDTDLFRKTRPVGGPEEASVRDSIPIGRFGQPREVAAATGFLLSLDAGYVNGQVLRVDGGASL